MAATFKTMNNLKSNAKDVSIAVLNARLALCAFAIMLRPHLAGPFVRCRVAARK